MRNFGRILITAMFGLLLLVPATALATTSDAPLADVAEEYEPILRAVAEELGVTYEELVSASEAELQDLMCAQLDGTTTEQLAADAMEALKDAPESEDLTEEQLAQIEANLPRVIDELAAEYCSDSGDGTEGAGGADGAGGAGTDGTASPTADAGSGDDDAEIPVPNRIDTGGGGTGATQHLPLAFGALFATLFGAVGISVTARRAD